MKKPRDVISEVLKVYRSGSPKNLEKIETCLDEKAAISLVGENIPFLYKLAFAAHSNPIEVIRSNFGSVTAQKRIGNFSVPAEYASARKLQAVKLSDYIDGLSESLDSSPSTMGYIGNHKMDVSMISALKLKIPSFIDLDVVHPPSVWLGPSGCITPLHVDGLDNTAITLHGCKRWHLFEPYYYDRLYMHCPFPDSAPNLHASGVDLRSVDTCKFPSFPLTRGITVDVPAGFLLYLPAGWSHFVETLGTSLMVNFWVDPEKRLPEILRG